MKRLRFVLLVSALSIAALSFACTEGDTHLASNERLTGISAAGTGKVTGSPDIVTVLLGVEVEMRTVEAARAAAATSMQAATDSLRANGVEQKDIQTVEFNVSPQYDFAPPANPSTQGRQTLRGYRVTNVVSAKVRKLDTIGKVIDDVSRAAGDAAVVRSLRFGIEDPSKLQAQARELAVKEARQRAEQLAQPAGVSLGKVISITEGQASPPNPQAPFAIRAPATGSPETPIQAGELEVVVNVTAVFEIQ
jgi:uncharacterized protein YggE